MKPAHSYDYLDSSWLVPAAVASLICDTSGGDEEKMKKST